MVRKGGRGVKITVINGPNLNFLGIREPEIYGSQTLEGLEKQIKEAVGNQEQLELLFFQSNHEGQLIDWIQTCYNEKVDGMIINPGALSHYSYSLNDAIKSVQLPTIEVHLSNIYKREAFRQHSVTAPSCLGVISGLGARGYILAVQALIEHISTINNKIS